MTPSKADVLLGAAQAAGARWGAAAVLLLAFLLVVAAVWVLGVWVLMAYRAYVAERRWTR